MVRFQLLEPVDSYAASVSIIESLSQANFLVLPKGRYMPIIDAYFQQYGIQKVASSAKKGSLYSDSGECIIKYAYIRDAAIADFVAHVSGSIGFTGAHQLFETFKENSPLKSEQIIAVENARFMLATSRDKLRVVKEKIRSNKLIRIASEYPETAHKLAKLCKWNYHLEPTKIGASEIMASLYPSIDAVIGITSTGQTVRENDLVLLQDHLEPVAICAIGASF